MSIDDLIDEEEVKRREALSEICDVSRHGVVDGVEFDFRHELLDPREWQMDTIGIESLPRFKTAFGPFIWFPWYGEFSEVKLRDEANLFYEHEKNRLTDLMALIESTDLPNDQSSKNDFRIAPLEEYIRDGTPECVIYAGDRVFIGDVHRQITGDELDHRHDTELRFASLNVTRSSGKTLAIQTPMVFRGITSVFTKGSHGNFFNKISRRICQHFHVRSLAAINKEIRDQGGCRFASDAALSAIVIAEQIREFRNLADSRELGDPRVGNAWKAWYTADSAVYLGYAWAKAEAELKLKPLARSALRVKAGATSGGAESGKARQRKRAETWEPIAKEMAKGIRAENPTLSQDDVATEIDARWKDPTCRPPRHPTLKGLISRMERAGELPKRQRT
jgi:hypothetical protein